MRLEEFSVEGPFRLGAGRSEIHLGISGYRACRALREGESCLKDGMEWMCRVLWVTGKEKWGGHPHRQG